MKIATFNANSVRMRLPIIIDWLCEHEPDAFAIQETKVDDSKLPASEFEEAGWHVAFHGQKGTNGVAIATRQPLANVQTGMGDPFFPEDARILCGEINGVTIINTYVPNGTAVGTDKFEYKLRWLARFRQYIDQRFSLGDPVLWLGDINIAPTPIDVYNSRRFLGGVGHHPLEFKALDEIKDWGLTDLFRRFHPEAGNYTYWDYVIPQSLDRNLGWRIDHIYASPTLAGKCLKCEIDKEPRRMDKPSDHTVVWAEFDV